MLRFLLLYSLPRLILDLMTCSQVQERRRPPYLPTPLWLTLDSEQFGNCQLGPCGPLLKIRSLGARSWDFVHALSRGLCDLVTAGATIEAIGSGHSRHPVSHWCDRFFSPRNSCTVTLSRNGARPNHVGLLARLRLTT